MKKYLFLTLLCLLWAFPAFGAIVYDAATINHSSTDGDATFTFNHNTCGGGGCTNLAAFACITAESATSIDNPTYNSVSMGSPIGCVTGWGGQITCIWGMIAPSTGTQAFAGSFVGNTSAWQAAIATFSGVDQATPFDTPPTPFSSASDGSSDADITVTSPTDDWAVSCYNIRNDSITVPTTVTQTLRASDDGAGVIRLQTYISTAVGTGTVAMGATFDGGTYGYQYVNHYAINMNAAAAAPPATVVRRRAVIIQ